MNQFMGIMTDRSSPGRGVARMRRAYAEEDSTAMPMPHPASGSSSEPRPSLLIYSKAPVAAPLSRAGVCGRRFWWLAIHRRQYDARIQHHHQPHLRHGGRRGLSLLAEHHRRLCDGRRRHQLQRRQRRQRPIRPVPGRRFRSPHGRSRPMSPAPWLTAGRTSPPIAP